MRQKEDLRQLILDAARELFVHHGFEGLSMHRLSLMIEYSPTTIYLYFKDKDELVRAVCAETFKSLAQGLEDLGQTPLDHRARLRSAMLGYVDFGICHPDHYKVAFIARAVVFASPTEFMNEDNPGWRSFAMFRTIVADYLTWAGLAKDPDLTAQGLWAGVHGLTSLFITQPIFPWKHRQELTENLVDTLLTGLEINRA